MDELLSAKEALNAVDTVLIDRGIYSKELHDLIKEALRMKAFYSGMGRDEAKHGHG